MADGRAGEKCAVCYKCDPNSSVKHHHVDHVWVNAMGKLYITRLAVDNPKHFDLKTAFKTGKGVKPASTLLRG